MSYNTQKQKDKTYKSTTKQTDSFGYYIATRHNNDSFVSNIKP